ncbi:MAG: hypothetical protein JRJ79_09970 [Deltaproteobacteria bacterium]|nr:hypothetical protein [Deltaproteobacteria bacterium]
MLPKNSGMLPIQVSVEEGREGAMADSGHGVLGDAEGDRNGGPPRPGVSVD